MLPIDTDKTIIAIDPGGTTGLAFVIDRQWNTATADDPAYIFQLFKQFNFDVVIIERFITNQNYLSKHGINTIEIVGGVKALCIVQDMKLYTHVPIQRMAYVRKANTMLKLKGERYVDHEADALAHLLFWLSTGK